MTITSAIVAVAACACGIWSSQTGAPDSVTTNTRSREQEVGPQYGHPLNVIEPSWRNLVITAIGDLDKDGLADLALGDPLWTGSEGRAGRGRVLLFSGSSGERLKEGSKGRLLGHNDGDYFGWSLAWAGRQELADGGLLIIGATFAEESSGRLGCVYGYDLPSGKLAWTLQAPLGCDEFGYSVAVVDAGNGKLGRFRLAVGAPGYRTDHGNGGLVAIADGAPPTIVNVLWNPKRGGGYGESLSVLRKLAAESPAHLVVGASASSRAYVYSLTGDPTRLLKTLRGEHEFATYGWDLCPAGDHDGDGQQDLIVSSRSRPGAVELIGSKTWKQMFGVSGKSDAGDGFGNAVSATDDCDSDGVTDFLVTAPGYPRYVRSITGVPFNEASMRVNREGYMRNGYIEAVSGRTRGVLWRYQSEVEDDFFGGDVTTCDDIDKDGVRDVAVTSARDADYCLTLLSGADGSVLWRVGI